jgi:hypothetical protein
MKRIVRVFVVLTSVALLALSGLFIGMPEDRARAGVAQTMVDEKEPNEDPNFEKSVEEFAQKVPFPEPDGVVVINGRVANDDEGGFSEEMEGKFGGTTLAGIFHDGPIALRVTLRWELDEAVGKIQGQEPPPIDLNMIIGTTVEPLDPATGQGIRTDGFTMLTLWGFTTGASVELWPQNPSFFTDPPPQLEDAESVAFYLPPQGVTANGEPILNDGHGRKLVVGIRHQPPEPMPGVPLVIPPPAKYTLSVETGNGSTPMKATTFASEVHRVDTDLISTGRFFGFEDNIVVNRFRPTRNPTMLTAISYPLFAFDNRPDPTTLPLRVLAFSGESDDTFDSASGELIFPPSLSETQILFDKVIPVPSTIQFLGEMVQFLVDPPVLIESDVVYVGFQFPQGDAASDQVFRTTGFAQFFDPSPVQYIRSFASSDGGMTWRLSRAREGISQQLVFLNANIRATFQSQGGSVPAKPARTKSHLNTVPISRIAPDLKKVVVREGLP